METVKILPNGTELNVMGGAYGKDEVYDEDIEVVIKIPKYAYDDLQKNKNLPNRSGIEKAITNGIVLSKGHWIQQTRCEGDEQPDLVCPNCGFKISWWDMGNFCAKCGTELEGGAE